MPRPGGIPDPRFYHSCGLIMGSGQGQFKGSPSDPVAVLDCVAKARYAFGYVTDEMRYFYLERFPDGEEMFGIAPLMR